MMALRIIIPFALKQPDRLVMPVVVAISLVLRVRFCCADIGQEVIVTMKVVDCNNNETACLITVTVVDTVKPVCQIQDITVACESFDPSLLAYGPTITDNCCMDTVSTKVNYAAFDTLCNKGTIIRNFKATDCQGNETLCLQRIVVEYQQDYFIRFPDDVVLTFIPETTQDYGAPFLCIRLLPYREPLWGIIPGRFHLAP